MKNLWNWIKNNPNRTMFLIPIILVAGISISHVVSWYDIANPISWAIYLSIAIEVGAMTALVAATNKIKGGVWFMFGMITLIQMIGNIFYSFKEIDPNGDLFKSWVELTGPLWNTLGSDPTDVISMKRWLAFLEGGLLPIISLTSLHFFVKYETPKIDTSFAKQAEQMLENQTEGVFGNLRTVFAKRQQQMSPNITDEFKNYQPKVATVTPTTQPTPQAAQPKIESIENVTLKDLNDQLMMLNKSIAQLVYSSTTNGTFAEQQIRVTKKLSGNRFG